MSDSLELTEIDRTHIKVARSAGALCNLDGSKMHAGNGLIDCTCGDCDQTHENLYHLFGISGTVRHHMTQLNGGPLLISPWSPIEHAGVDGEALVRHIKWPVPKKRIPAIVLCTHAPCAAAYDAGVDFLDVLRLLLEAKQRVRKVLGMKDVEKIHCFCHVDHGGNHKRTYCVPRKATFEFLEAQGRPVRTL